MVKCDQFFRKGMTISNIKQMKLDWIVEYIKNKRTPVDVLNDKFMDEYVEKFHAKIEISIFGPNRCKELNKMLSLGYKIGILKRSAIGLSNGWYPGFPRWVYVYNLNDN